MTQNGGNEMCEPVDPLRMLRAIPFSVASLVECCTKSGTYERDVARRIYESIRADVDRYTNELDQRLREPQ